LKNAEVDVANLSESLTQHADDTLELADNVLTGLVHRLGIDGTRPEAIARLRALVADQRARVRDGRDTYDANRDFHLELVAASGNPHLLRFAETLWVARIARRIYAAQAIDARRLLYWADDHDRIIDAVAAGDGNLAALLTREHIAASRPPSTDVVDASGQLGRELKADDGAAPGGRANLDAASG